MITPFYPLPISHAQVRSETIVNVALCGLATIQAFFNKSLCHGDIKPSNMMFQASSGVVVTIDYGSCVSYGKTLAEISHEYGLDCSLQGSLQYDLTCLATSILQLKGVQLADLRTRNDVRSWLADRSEGDILLTISALCLDDAISSPCTIKESCLQRCQSLPNSSDWIVDIDSIWPAKVE